MFLPNILGKILYILGYPFILLWLKGSSRAYVVLRVGDEIFVTKNRLGLHVKWRLPGGGLKKQEDVLTGLAREVKEELGIAIPLDATEPLSEVIYRARPGYSYKLFLVTYANKPELDVNRYEHAAATWITLTELRKSKLSTELEVALSLLA